MKKLHYCILIIFNLFLTSCAGSKYNDDIALQEQFNIGLENLENEKYLQAQLNFKQIVIRGTGSDLGDDAQYFLGEAYFRNEEYLEAIAEYQKLTRRMGFSPFVEDARFKICEAYRIESPKYYHDQEYTEKALERYQEFLDDFQQSKLKGEVLKSIELLLNSIIGPDTIIVKASKALSLPYPVWISYPLAPKSLALSCIIILTDSDDRF